jgi:hypothetical protein
MYLSKVSFTFDLWTLDPGDPYISITEHYIDALMDKPHDWELKMEQLAFKNVKGWHMGKNIADILVKTVDQYSIQYVGRYNSCFNLMRCNLGNG